MMPKICNWAKYHNRHSSKSIWVIKLYFCQNDPHIRESFWQNNSLGTLVLFELQPIMIFSPVANFGHHPLHIFMLKCLLNNLFYFFSLAVHPNKLLIATGQATGHDRREGKVSNLWFCYKTYILFLQKLFLSF